MVQRTPSPWEGHRSNCHSQASTWEAWRPCKPSLLRHKIHGFQVNPLRYQASTFCRTRMWEADWGFERSLSTSYSSGRISSHEYPALHNSWRSILNSMLHGARRPMGSRRWLDIPSLKDLSGLLRFRSSWRKSCRELCSTYGRENLYVPRLTG